MSVSRILTNAGNPLIDAEGNPLSGVAVTFQPINDQGRPSDFFAISGERIASQKRTAVTDGNGEFSIELQCTSQAIAGAYYLCSIDRDTNGVPWFSSFFAPLDEGDGELQFVDFKAAGNVLASNGVSALTSHIEGSTPHIYTDLVTGDQYRIVVVDGAIGVENV